MIRIAGYILGTGLGILFLAIILNIVASFFDISTWYDFLTQLKNEGLGNAMRKTSLVSLIFLFIIYPFLLGLVAYFILARFIK